MSLAPDTRNAPHDTARDEQRVTTRADALVDELERRIHELHGHEEQEFGNFTRLDWLILLLGAVVVPILLVIRFAP